MSTSESASRGLSLAAQLDTSRELLASLPLFDALPPDTTSLLAESFVRVSFEFGEPIIEEGEPGEAFYVIVSGQARVLREGPHGEEIPLVLLGTGDTFGERALAEGANSSATVRAKSRVGAWRLDGAVFRALVGTNLAVREQVGVDVVGYKLGDFFRLETTLGRLSLQAIELLVKRVVPVDAEQGQAVIREGDEPDRMYFVEEGHLRVFRNAGGGVEDLRYLRRGDLFGELGLLTRSPRSATVEALSPCRLLSLDRDAMDELLDASPEFRAVLDEWRARYEYQSGPRVPLDFADEILPADAHAQVEVSPEQVAHDDGATALPRDASGAIEVPQELRSPSRERIRNFPLLRQIDQTDCGAACVAMVCRYFGREVGLARARDAVNTSSDGTSLAGLARGGESLGLSARTVKSSPDAAERLPVPAVLHWGGNHWVVMYDAHDGRVRIADPATGHQRVPEEELAARWTGYAALFEPTDRLADVPESRASLRWMLPFVRPHFRALAGALAIAVFAAVLQAALPLITKFVVDDVLPDQDYGLLAVVALSLLGVGVALVGATIAQGYLVSRVAVRLDEATLNFVTGKLLALPMNYFASRRTGDIARRLEGVQQVRAFIVQSAASLLTSVVMLVVVLGVMAITNIVMTLAFLATVPLYVGLMRVSARRLGPVFETLEEAFGRYQSHQIDAIRGIEAVKALGAEDALREEMAWEFEKLSAQRFRADFTILTYTGLVQLTTFFSLTLFLYVGALQVLSGDLSIGGLVAFNSLVVLANAPIVTLLSLWDEYQISSVVLNRLNDILEQEPEQGRDHSELVPVRTLEGAVRLQGLGFRFVAGSADILSDIDLDVPPGTRCAIVGRSGSGKTTLVKLLAGLLEPTDGAIYYDGVELRTVRYRDLRRQIGFVLQDNYLFDGTIAHNIAFGEPDPDIERVTWAAEVANARGFIERLPLSYQTRVGESGLRLSGGQRQRVAIARAIYRRPPVLIFDEATSALDAEAERAVQDSMDALLENRTSFVIAHRLSTIRGSDLILVLDEGRLVEQGTHQELLERDGVYAHLCAQQLEL